MTRILDVYLKNIHAGTLEETNGRMAFTYRAGLPANAAVSRAMPVRAEAYGHNECHAYFGGLLPEEDQRLILAQALHISEKNDFRMLEAIGRDCAGAISLWAHNETPTLAKHVFEKDAYRSGYNLSYEQLRDLFPRLRKNPLTEKKLRFSLAGAQSKIALLFDKQTQEFYFPDQTQISTHIVKPASSRFENSVENEWFCTVLCHKAQLPVAPSWMVDLGQGEKVFVTERYDRAIVTNNIIDEPSYLDRLHQEDFCQALGIPSEHKYQEGQGPGYGACFALVDDVCTRPASQRFKLLSLLLFNYLIGNNDAHGKNFSLLYPWVEDDEKIDLGEIEVSPFYDLVCTELYEDLDNSMSMKIGARFDPYLIMKKDLEIFCQETGISYPLLQRFSRNLAAELLSAATEMRNQLPRDQDIYDRVLRVISRRANHILEITAA